MASGWVLSLHSSSLYPQLNHPGPSVKAPAPELSSTVGNESALSPQRVTRKHHLLQWCTVVKFPRILLPTDRSSRGSHYIISCRFPSSRVSNYWGRVQEEPLQGYHDYQNRVIATPPPPNGYKGQAGIYRQCREGPLMSIPAKKWWHLATSSSTSTNTCLPLLDRSRDSFFSFSYRCIELHTRHLTCQIYLFKIDRDRRKYRSSQVYHYS